MTLNRSVASIGELVHICQWEQEWTGIIDKLSIRYRSPLAWSVSSYYFIVLCFNQCESIWYFITFAVK